ncbi:MAG TPA: hypothetical protein VFG66_11945 [Gemmatimonadales bacterium]|nr:hypothetical protein [Gemmatimonadales bacterium]
MPVDYRLEPDGVVWTALTGLVRGEELVQHALELGAAGCLARPLLLDARGGLLRLEEPEIAWLADVVGGMRRIHGQAAVALLTEDEASSAVARSYAVLMHAHNPHFAAFRLSGEAEAWVHQRTPAAPPGSARRQVDAAPPVRPKLIGWARLHPTHVRRPLGLNPTRWYPVIERPADIPSAPLPGYVWLDDGGRYRQVWPGFLETIRSQEEEEG